jgi:phosphocarrier protein HPr
MRRSVLICNKLGLHARAAAKLVQCASRFESELTLALNGKEVNGKSIMGVMMLAAGRGTEVEVIAQGSDEAQALDEVSSLIQNRFGEAE